MCQSVSRCVRMTASFTDIFTDSWLGDLMAFSACIKVTDQWKSPPLLARFLRMQRLVDFFARSFALEGRRLGNAALVSAHHDGEVNLIHR